MFYFSPHFMRERSIKKMDWKRNSKNSDTVSYLRYICILNGGNTKKRKYKYYLNLHSWVVDFVMYSSWKEECGNNIWVAFMTKYIKLVFFLYLVVSFSRLFQGVFSIFQSHPLSFEIDFAGIRNFSLGCF